MSRRTLTQLRDDALAIWQAGLRAVRSDRLVQANVQVEGTTLRIVDHEFDLREIEKIVVVGAGKAGAGMALGLEEALGPRVLFEKRVTGWVNVPADCVRPLATITLHPARPAGKNEPTAEGVEGTHRILKLVESCGPRDLCICLISGGGSALLPAPVEGITLEEKQAVTRFLSGAGANIRELNTVRKRLSRIKGGGLAQACQAGVLVTLIISDVLGDPLDVIASGPTVEEPGFAAQNASHPNDALAVLAKFDPERKQVPESVYWVLETSHPLPLGEGGERSEPGEGAGPKESAGRNDTAGQASSGTRASSTSNALTPALSQREREKYEAALSQGKCEVINEVIGNLAMAVDAAGMEAERRGYSHAMLVAREMEGPAEEVGRHLAQMALRMRSEEGPDCLITGGEPTVTLADEKVRGLGGRNQQLVLAALEYWKSHGAAGEGIVLLSGGTDGEDGPTDAAGAIIDVTALAQADALGLDAAEYLRRNNAYRFFETTGGLIKTGPTHTNVCDVRVIVVDR